MNELSKLIGLLLFLALSFSCDEKESSPKEISKPEVLSSPKTDSLTFTSGIRSVFQDSKGNYWIGSGKEGAAYFDGKSFQNFTQAEGLPDNQIRSIQEDKNGTIWFGTGNGISSYDGKIFTNYTAKTSSQYVGFEQTSDYLWFSADVNPGINQLDGTNLNYLPFPIPSNESRNNSYGVTTISKGADNNAWKGTYAALFHYDGSALSFFDKSKLALKEGEVLHIRSVFEDSKGRVWVGNNGIGVLLIQGNSAINFSGKNGLINANSSKDGNRSPAGTLEHVFAIEEDSEGNIWFGDRDTGAWKYDGQTMTNYTIDDKLSSQMAWCIYNDNENNLLFGMEDGGVYKFNDEVFSKIF